MHGIVVHTDGRPAAGISVATGGVVTTTDAHGRFTLERQPEWGNFVVLTRPTGYTASPWWHRVPSTHDEDATELRFELVPEEQPLPYEFLHITDTHLTVPNAGDHGHYEGALREDLARFLSTIGEHSPNARSVMITGDLVDNGVAAEYEVYLQALDSAVTPVHLIPGNHDHMRGIYDTVISRNNYLTNDGTPDLYEEYIGPRWYSFDVAGLHVVGMDWHSHELSTDHEVQNAWLRADLARLEPGSPWILLFHDQPGASVLEGLPWQPIATFSGHWHTSRVVDVDGTLHVNSPTTFFASLDYSPPAFRHVTWDGEQITLRTEVLLSRGIPGALTSVSTATFAPTHSSTGEPSVLWHGQLSGAGHRQSVAVADGKVFAGAQVEDRPAGFVEAFDLETGAPLWQTPTRSAVKTAPAYADIDGGIVLAAEVSGDLLALDAATGSERWRLASSDLLRRFAWGTPAVSGGRVFLGDPSDLRCVDVRTGSVIWRRTDLSPHHNLANHAAPLILDDLLVVGLWPTPLNPVGLDTGTGESVWEAPTFDTARAFTPASVFLMGTATYDPNRDAVLMPGRRATVSLERATGAQNWAATHGTGYSPAAPAVTPAGYAVAVAGYGLRMLEPATGAVIWEVPIEGDAPFAMSSYQKRPNPVIAPPVLVGDDLLLPGLDGVIRRFDLEGRLLGTTQLASPIAAALVHTGNRIIAVGTDGTVLALDADRVARQPLASHTAETATGVTPEPVAS